MKIFLGADHNGFGLKEQLKDYLEERGVLFEDLGNKELNPNDDYPDFALKVAKEVAAAKGEGILICGSGAGVCIAANKVKGVRAALGVSSQQAQRMKGDDDVNILCLDSDGLTISEAQTVVKAWLTAKFNNLPRHQRRLAKIKKIEEGKL